MTDFTRDSIDADGARSWFDTPSVAQRYRQGRVENQRAILATLWDRLGREKRIARALDVACGTGRSTVGLRYLADQVVGVDVSARMLAWAPAADHVAYVRATAEVLPFADRTFDLLHIVSAFHWFDRSKFLPEAGRVLVPDGWLVIYRGGSPGVMPVNPAYARWQRQVFAARYPAPPRDEHSIADADAQAAGLRLLGQDEVTTTAHLTPIQLVDHLVTQSGVVFAVEFGGEPIDSARSWLLDQVRPFFAEEAAPFVDTTKITYLRRRSLVL